MVVLSVTIDAGNCRGSTYLLLTFCAGPSHLFYLFVAFDIWHFPLGQSLCYVLGSNGRVGLWGEEEVFQTQGPNFVMLIAAVRRTGIFQEQRCVWYSLCNNILAPKISSVRNRRCIRPQPASFKSLLTSFFLSFLSFLLSFFPSFFPSFCLSLFPP